MTKPERAAPPRGGLSLLQRQALCLQLLGYEIMSKLLNVVENLVVFPALGISCILLYIQNNGRKGETGAGYSPSKLNSRWDDPERAKIPETPHGVQHQPAQDM